MIIREVGEPGNGTLGMGYRARASYGVYPSSASHPSGAVAAARGVAPQTFAGFTSVPGSRPVCGTHP